MYYDSCYLYSDPQNIDHHYRYVIWSGDKDKIHVTCWDMYSSRCVFVLKPEKIISKYMEDMEYTDFANDKTRNDRYKEEYSKKEIADFNGVMSHARKIIDILTHED